MLHRILPHSTCGDPKLATALICPYSCQSCPAKSADLSRHFCVVDFMEHCIQAYNWRCEEMNTVECRLALFLDPRYKAAADAPGTFQDLVMAVRD